MEIERLVNEPHEGSWIYVSAPLGHLNGTAQALSQGIVSTIHSRGWEVVDSDATALPHRGDRPSSAARALEALRTADACLFDVSSPAVGPDVGIAMRAGRPVIALAHVDAPPQDALAALLRGNPLLRVITYADVDACIEALRRTLADPVWLASVSLAAADVR